MHGEPSLNPYARDIVQEFRRVLPRAHIMMTSNGGGFVMAKDLGHLGIRQYIDALFDAGLNVLALDDYKTAKYVGKIRPLLDGLDVRDYPADGPDASPHKRRDPKTKMVVIIQDISEAEKGNHSSLNNHTGCGAPLNDSGAGKRCAKPFREMSIRWDGNVAICCNDWRGVYKCGNVAKSTVSEIWNGPEMQAARSYLYHGMRTFKPCLGCDATSTRVGLLPDSRGKETLPAPTEKDAKTVKRATAGSPYTQPVRTPWEQ